MGAIPLAVLIDGENVAASHIPSIMERARVLGEPATRCVVGDFTANRLAEWIRVAPAHALELVFQPSCGKGMNSADIALTIRAMDLLALNVFTRFLIVSSDSDFAPLALRLGRAGVAVYGMGAPRPDSAWRTACTAFFDLASTPATGQETSAVTKPVAAKPHPPAERPGPSQQDLENVREILRKATEAKATWLPLSELGQLICQSSKELGARVCGNGRLQKVLRADDSFVVCGSGPSSKARLSKQTYTTATPATSPATALAAGMGA